MNRILIRNAIALAAGLILLMPAVRGQGVQFSIPDTAGKRNDTLMVPLHATSLSVADSVYSGQITFAYNANLISIFGVESNGTISQTANPLFNPTTRTFAFAATTPLAGIGPFVRLKIRILASTQYDTATISIASITLNEGLPRAAVVGGLIRVYTIHIAPQSPPTPLVTGDSLQFSVTGTPLAPLTWWSSDTTVGAVDRTGKLHTLSSGQVKVFVSDTRGLRDSTALFPVFSPLLRSLTLFGRDTAWTQSLAFDYPILVSNVSGLGILSCQFTVTFNGSILQALSVHSAGTLTGNWSSPVVNIINGRVDIALAGTQPLAGSGTVVFIRFLVLSKASGSTQISFANALFNESINATTVNAAFQALPAPVPMIQPQTAVLTKDDSLLFRVVSDGVAPYRWRSTNTAVASIDSATGILRAKSRGTTTVAVVDSRGFASSTGDIVVNDFRLSLPDTLVGYSDSIDFPVMVSGVSGTGITAWELRIAYSSCSVAFVEIIQHNTKSEGFAISCRDTLDTLRIAAAGTLPLEGSGILLKLRLRRSSSPCADNVPTRLRIALAQFNEPGPNGPTATIKHGTLLYMYPPVAPTLVLPANNALNVSRQAQLIWRHTPTATEYRILAATDSSFTTLVLDTLLSSDTVVTTPILQPATPYFWKVRAQNIGGSGPYSSVLQFTTGLTVGGDLIDGFIPRATVLAQNYPNPFNPTTMIGYELGAASSVTLRVYDLLGRQVAVLADEKQSAGLYRVIWKAGTNPSGVYLCKLTAGEFTQTVRMLLIR